MNTQLPTRVLYYGKDKLLPEQKELQAGPLSLIFEDGDLRYVRLGNQEIIRRIYVAIRDRNWDTILPKLSNLQMDTADDKFQITYDVENKQDDIHFFWQGTITGEVDGTVTFNMDGEAISTFERNRIGFCLLHPMACSSIPCRVEKADGTTEKGVFPEFISPHQPFMDIQAISHQVEPDLWAEVRFSGDIFEMEDQRNWTDASYKTYCTPLAVPYPVEVKAGTKVSQSIKLSLKSESDKIRPIGKIKHLSNNKDGQTIFTFNKETSTRIPHIGLGIASHGQPLSEKELEHLKAINLSHLRVDIDLNLDYQPTLQRAINEANSLGISLEIALHLDDSAEEQLESWRRAVQQFEPPIATYLIFHQDEPSTSSQWIEVARRHLSDVRIGTGTNAYFTELNRDLPSVELLDFICYSINPQVHAFDNSSLTETLEAQAVTVESARKFSEGLPLAVTPVTLLPRFNPNATMPEPEPKADQLPAQVDMRQMSLYGAGWTLGSLKHLSQSGVCSTTYYETSGWRGVMETEKGSQLPEKFQSIPGTVFPLYHVLADVGEFANGEIMPSTSSNPLKLEGIAIKKGNLSRIILANLSFAPLKVTVKNLAENVLIRHLNEANIHSAITTPNAFRAEWGRRFSTSKGNLTLDLDPYAVARIDDV